MSENAKDYPEVVNWLVAELGITVDARNPPYALLLCEQVPAESEVFLSAIIYRLQALLRCGKYEEVNKSAHSFLERQELPLVYESRLYHLLGTAAWSIGNVGSALKHFEQAHSKNCQTGDKSFERTINTSLGVTYLAMGSYEKALECTQDAHDKYIREGSILGIATTTINIAAIYNATGNMADAQRCCLQSKALYYELGHLNGAAYPCIVLGDVHYKLEEFDTALENYQQAHDLMVETSDRRGEARALSLIGSCRAHRAMQSKDGKTSPSNDDIALGCLEMLQKARNLYDSLGVCQEFQTEAWIAICNEWLGDKESAYKYAVKACDIAVEREIGVEDHEHVFKQVVDIVQRIVSEHE